MLSRLLAIFMVLVAAPIPTRAQDSGTHDCIMIYLDGSIVGFAQISMFDLDTNALKFPDQPTAAFAPLSAFSSDGKYAAFLWSNDLDERGRGSLDDMAFYVENLETGELTLILPQVDGPGPVWFTALAWSPDGEGIALLASDGTQQILLTANHDGSGQLISPLGATLEDGSLRWSADGQHLYVGGLAWLADDHTRIELPAPTEIPPPMLAPTPSFEWPAGLSSTDNLELISVAPDQKTAAFGFSSDETNTSGLIAYAPALELAGQLKIDRAWMPVWSPDGSRLAFLRWADDYHLVVEVLDVTRFEFTHIATVTNTSHEFYGTIRWTKC